MHFLRPSSDLETMRPRKKRDRKAIVLRDPQPYSKHWSAQRVRNNRLPVHWERQFVSAQDKHGTDDLKSPGVSTT